VDNEQKIMNLCQVIVGLLNFTVVESDLRGKPTQVGTMMRDDYMERLHHLLTDCLADLPASLTGATTPTDEESVPF
jgi:hypothetical protein